MIVIQFCLIPELWSRLKKKDARTVPIFFLNQLFNTFPYSLIVTCPTQNESPDPRRYRIVSYFPLVSELRFLFHKREAQNLAVFCSSLLIRVL